MALTDADPPTTRPIGNVIRRPLSCGCGTLSRFHDQAFRSRRLASGIWSAQPGYLGPASITSTRLPVCSASRLATTQPAVPAPIMMMSAGVLMKTPARPGAAGRGRFRTHRSGGRPRARRSRLSCTHAAGTRRKSLSSCEVLTWSPAAAAATSNALASSACSASASKAA